MGKKTCGKIISLLMCGAMLAGIPASAAPTLAQRLDYKAYDDFSNIAFNNNYYGEYLEKYADKYAPAGTEIKLDVFNFTAEGARPEEQQDGEKGRVICWRENTAALSFRFTAESEGLYSLAFSYFPIDGNTLGITRGIRLDGEYPFDEAENITLARRFTDSEKPRKNNLGDELMPQQNEVKVWLSERVWDNQGVYSTPLAFYLSAGEHTLTLEYIEQPALISEISFVAAKKAEAYKTVLKGYSTEEKGETLRFEAEDKDYVLGKSSSSVLIGSDSDETLTPKATVSKKYNYIGGASWATGGDSISWKFSVKKAGLYKIALRSVQNANSGVPVYRTIELDGNIPFAEAAGYEFPYNARWNTHIIGKNGEPYLFYLTAGEHTLKMTAVTGDKTPIIQSIEKANSKLQVCYQNIVMVTGQSPDLNYDYELDKSISGLENSLGEITDILADCIKQLSAITNKTSTVENSIKQVKATIEKYKNDTDLIPGGLDDFTAAMTNMGDWLTALKTSSLAVDYIEAAAPDTELANPKQSLLNRIVNAVRNLILSYTKDYNAIGSVGSENSGAGVLNVWISRGKEWAEILKELADSEFSAKNNVNLKFNLLPEGAFSGTVNTLLLSVNAGKIPDVVLNMTANNTAEYAARGVIQDLKGYSDFEDFSGYTVKELFKPISYGGAVYGLPESMNFTVMFYRTDMFERLHMEVPNTWTDVYNTLLPRLNQYKLNMYIPQNYELFLYQYGGSYYSADGKTTGLSSEAAYNAFERYIKNYTEYGFPYNISFYNRFRTGETIVGIGGQSEYMQITYAAPELKGKWAVAPVPATVGEDGQLNRAVGSGLQTVSVIMKDSKNKETAWKFLKWWMSGSAQSEYGRRLESRLGISSRWGSANLEAYTSLAWSSKDLSVIKSALENIHEAPYVPGGYFTARHITNATARCITGGYTPRDSLEEAVEQINIELERKRRDFGIDE